MSVDLAHCIVYGANLAKSGFDSIHVINDIIQHHA